MLTIEFEPPSESEPCECCGGQTTSLTRYVHRDGDAYAIYYAKFSNNHPERSVVATISLGEWGEGSSPEQRVAFALEIRSNDHEYQISLIDAVLSPWKEAKFIGRTLNREEALKHPLVKEVFNITDQIVTEDIPLREYLEGQLKCTECGKEHSMEEMELTFKRPDDVASLSNEERVKMVKDSSDLCILEGTRFFVRTVLPLPVLDRDIPYSIGLWVEVQQSAYNRIFELWSETDQTNEPPFSANIANKIPTLPDTIGLAAYLHLAGPTTRPSIVIASEAHPLYVEQQRGISAHRAYEYSSMFA